MPERQQVEAMLRAMYAQRSSGDVEASLAHFTEDATFRIAGTEALGPMTQPVTGHAELRIAITQLARDWDWSDYHIDTIMIDGDHAVVHSRGRMRYTPRNIVIETETLDLITFRDGKVCDFLEFCDTDMALQLVANPTR